ncbi:MAG: GNAT family N-acetyltransferase [Clostridia bacterium]
MTVYFKHKNLIIRAMKQADAEAFSEAFSLQGWHKSIELFTGYFNQQESGERKVLVAEVDGQVAGYITMLPKAETGPFAAQNIPELADFNVLINFQTRGIGTQILDVAEQLAKEFGNSISLAVGLHSGYGRAQRMYVRRGFAPDGSGVWYQGRQLNQYALCANDDDLVLYMKKDLK